jgi:NAD dependent epimerase/dehydratase family enzyme
VLVSVSAIAYYGNRGDEILSEDSQAGTRASSVPSKVPSVDYLSDLCRQWEHTTQIAKEAGIRVVNLRLGIVLSSSGGLLAKILPVFKWGLGGRVGRGNQYVSWIALEDLLTIILSMIANETFMDR